MSQRKTKANALLVTVSLAIIGAGSAFSMLAPSFYTLPGDEIFVPTQAHPGEDAGGDIRACITKEKGATRVEIQDCLDSYFNNSSNSFVFVNGVKANSDLLQDLRKDFLIDAGPGICLRPGETVLVNSGFKIICQDLRGLDSPWHDFVPYYQIVSRSGLAHKHKVIVTNSPGIIDFGYQDWVKVSLTNNSNNYHFFTRGARIAQGIYSLAFNHLLCSHTTDESVLRSAFTKSLRANDGFGSTALT